MGPQSLRMMLSIRCDSAALVLSSMIYYVYHFDDLSVGKNVQDAFHLQSVYSQDTSQQ